MQLQLLLMVFQTGYYSQLSNITKSNIEAASVASFILLTAGQQNKKRLRFYRIRNLFRFVITRGESQTKLLQKGGLWSRSIIVFCKLEVFLLGYQSQHFQPFPHY